MVCVSSLSSLTEALSLGAGGVPWLTELNLCIAYPIFSYTHRTTDVTEQYFVRVDVTEEFPFLVPKLSSYYDR